MKNKGWRGESKRHSKAAKGIKSGRKHYMHSVRTKMHNRPMVGTWSGDGGSATFSTHWKGKRISASDFDEMKYLKTHGEEIELAKIPRRKVYVVNIHDDEGKGKTYVFDDEDTATKAYDEVVKIHGTIKPQYGDFGAVTTEFEKKSPLYKDFLSGKYDYDLKKEHREFNKLYDRVQRKHYRKQ